MLQHKRHKVDCEKYTYYTTNLHWTFFSIRAITKTAFIITDEPYRWRQLSTLLFWYSFGRVKSKRLKSRFGDIVVKRLILWEISIFGSTMFKIKFVIIQCHGEILKIQNCTKVTKEIKAYDTTAIINFLVKGDLLPKDIDKSSVNQPSKSIFLLTPTNLNLSLSVGLTGNCSYTSKLIKLISAPVSSNGYCYLVCLTSTSTLQGHTGTFMFLTY